MGKQAKKKVKTAAQASGQRQHNRKTRGINTNRKPIVWSEYTRKVTDKDDNEREVVEQTLLPHGTMWNPWAPERMDKKKATGAFRDLHLDWREELMHYAAEVGAKTSSTPNGDGTFTHSVYILEEKLVGNKKRKVKSPLVEVISAQPLKLVRAPRK